MRIFCTYCGAANAVGTPLCLACATPLTTTLPSPYTPRSEYAPPIIDQQGLDYSYGSYYPGVAMASYTPTSVTISHDMLAGIWPRLGAYILDTVLVGFSMLSTLIIAGIISTTLLESFWPLFSLLGPALYFVTAWATSGQTIGYRAMGLQLIQTDGTKPSLRTALVRYVGVVACLFLMFPCLLGFLWMLWDDRRQTWHDKMANTLVVKT